MAERGSYKIASRGRSFEAFLPPHVRSELRARRILDSLRSQILEDEGADLRIRRVFSTPREIFRIELERPELGYQRITLLDRDALEELLEAEEIRQRVGRSPAS